MYIIAAILIFGCSLPCMSSDISCRKGLRRARERVFHRHGPGHPSRQRAKRNIRYAFAIGGFCAMEGEDEERRPARAGEAGLWKKLLIFVAGAAMNSSPASHYDLPVRWRPGLYTAEIVELDPAFPQQGENGIMVGDVIWAINGERIYLKSDVSTVLGVVDLDENGTIRNDGQARRREAQAHADAADPIRTKTARRCAATAHPMEASWKRRRLFGCNTAGTTRSILCALYA